MQALAKQRANLAQLVEQLIRNEQVVGSNPMVGSLATETPKARHNFVGGLFCCGKILAIKGVCKT
jgi:hypothetical protein